MEVDVAVIGAGPAGSTLATLLARRGVSVALIDRDTFPRDKVCGEFLSYDALPILDRLGVISTLDQVDAPWIRSCEIVSGDQRFAFELPAVARGVSRFTFDKLLFDAAVSAGAVPLAGSSADVRDGAVVTNGKPIKARVIVGAWGRWGRMDQTLKRPFVRERRHRYFGFKRHYRNGIAGADVIELHSFRAGYLGVGPVENARVNICGLVHQSRIRGMKSGWEAFTIELAEEQRSLRRLFASHLPVNQEFLSSEPVIFVAKSPVENGILLLGDAAGLVDPLTGSGMAIAIQSALIAAPFVLERLSDSATADAKYRAAFEAFFRRRLLWSRRVAYLLCRPKLLAMALRTNPRRSIGRFVVENTRADGQMLERAMKNWFG